MNQVSLSDHAIILQNYLQSIRNGNPFYPFETYRNSILYHLDEIVFELSNSIYIAWKH